jgi:hypothetical protein
MRTVLPLQFTKVATIVVAVVVVACAEGASTASIVPVTGDADISMAAQTLTLDATGARLLVSEHDNLVARTNAQTHRVTLVSSQRSQADSLRLPLFLWSFNRGATQLLGDPKNRSAVGPWLAESNTARQSNWPLLTPMGLTRTVRPT